MDKNTQNTQTAQTEELESTALIPVTDDAGCELDLNSDRFANLDISADIGRSKSSYCSMVAADNKSKVTLYNACSNPKKLSEMINKQIKLLHVYAEIIQCMSESTGQLVNVPRVILIDEKGQGYQAVSIGIYNAVKRIIALFGQPGDWDRPHTVEIQNVPLAAGHTFNLIVID